jgi:DNA-binding NarL/FixJ family response regulator
MILTSKELEIIRLMAEGNSIKMIREATKYSECSIETFRCNLYKKLGVKNAPHCVAVAIRKGLIQ